MDESAEPDDVEMAHQQRMADAVAWTLWFATQAAAQVAAAVYAGATDDKSRHIDAGGQP